MNLLQSIAVVGAQSNIFAEGLATLVVGIGVVFLALTALIIILETSGKFFDNLNHKEEAKKAAALAAAQAATPVEEPVVIETAPEDDLELIAVITATIAASMGTSVEGLQVRSIRKTNNAWVRAGRSEQLYN